MPLCTNNKFTVALRKQLKYEPTTKRARGASDDNFSVATALYYEPLLQQANAALLALRGVVAARIRPALKEDRRMELLGALGARLEYYAWQYHVALAPPNHNLLPAPSQIAIDDLCGTAVPVGPNFLARHAVTTITAQFIAYITAVVNHVDADWADIRNVFFPQWQLQELLELGASGSDSHKGGHSVVILTFQGRSLPPVAVPATAGDRLRNFFTISTARKLRLVYKPSDLTLDFLMVGDTAHVRAQVAGLPNPPGGSLLENLNTLLTPGGAFVADPAFAARPPLQLPIYSLLPRNGGVLATAYGYIEFLDHGPEATPVSAVTFNVQLRDRDRLHWDWITEDNNDLIDYYRIFGWYCAIGLNFGLADAHNQNVMVHNKKPHLIDMEVSFKWICETLDKTGLQDVMSSPGPAKKGDWCHIFYRNGGVLSRTTGTQAAVYINHALDEAFALIQADPGNALQGWLGCAPVAGAIARYTPRATAAFGMRLRGVYLTPRAPVPGVGVAHGVNFTSQYDTDQQTWYRQNEAEHRPNYSLACPQHEYQCYLNCDYPAFYRQLNSMDLMDARGAVVIVGAPVAAWNAPNMAAHLRPKTIAGAHYFDHYPAVFRFEIPNLTALPAPGNTFARLDAGNLILDLTAQFAAAVPAIVLTGAAVESVEKESKHWRIIDGPRIFHLRRGKTPAGLDDNNIYVFETGTAVAMVIRQFDRFRNDGVFRARLLADAKAFVNGRYPPPAAPVIGPPPPPIYNGF